MWLWNWHRSCPKYSHRPFLAQSVHFCVVGTSLSHFITSLSTLSYYSWKPAKLNRVLGWLTTCSTCAFSYLYEFWVYAKAHVSENDYVKEWVFWKYYLLTDTDFSVQWDKVLCSMWDGHFQNQRRKILISSFLQRKGKVYLLSQLHLT